MVTGKDRHSAMGREVGNKLFLDKVRLIVKGLRK